MAATTPRPKQTSAMIAPFITFIAVVVAAAFLLEHYERKRQRREWDKYKNR